MLKKIIPGFFLLFIYCLPAHAQAGRIIHVFAERQTGDSVDKAVQLLIAKLSEPIQAEIRLHPAAGEIKEGILLLKTEQAIRYKVSFPSSLKKMGPEGIYIAGDARTVKLIGNTALALQEAVSVYLEQLGFHQFLPGKDWVIIPRIQTPYKKMSILTKPDYECRIIANGHAYGNSQKLADDFNSWADINRLGGAFRIKTGHCYEEIVLRNTELFKKHPEYFGRTVSAGTIPAEFKFNVGNKDLVDFIVKDAFYRYEMQVRTGDYAGMLSMEPSDGGKYCDKPECLVIGNASDQAFYLTNKVAKAFQEKYPGVWIGGYAYNEHILPPKAPLERNIFIAITNGFNFSKYSTSELLEIWGKKAAKTGLYDYISVFEWDNDLPGQVIAAQTDVIRKNVRKFYKSGARAYIAESVIGWVNKGPGQYVFSRLLWNRNVNTDSLLKQFYTISFENAAPLIQKLYESWSHYTKKLPAENDMYDWFHLTDEAYKMAVNPAVKKRINHIKSYLYYLVLIRKLRISKSDDDLFKLLNYAYRTYETADFPTIGVMVSLPGTYKHPSWSWNVSPDQPWKKDNRPVSDAELEQLFNQAMNSFSRTEGVISFQPPAAFTRLSSVTNIPNKKYTLTPHASWHETEYVIEVSRQSAGNYFEIKSDFSSQPPLAKPVEVMLYPLKPSKTSADEEEKPLLKFEQFKKQQNEKFSLASLKPGTYRLVVDDKRKVFILKFSPDIAYSIVAGYGKEINTTSVAGLNWFYFYVPPGVKKFQLTKSNGFVLDSPAGRIIDKQKLMEETFIVDVQPGESGIWTISMQGGIISLDGVPPYLGDHPSTMLVPSYLKK